MRVRNFVYWMRGDEHLPLLKLSIDSVRSSNPEARFYLMAEGFDDPHIDGVHFWPCDYGTPLMLANLQAQCEFLVTARNERGATAFLDADTIVLRQLVGIPNADLVVTFRNYVGKKNGEKVEGVAKYMPYNYGVVFAADTLPAKESFLWLRDRIAKYHPQLQAWYGNQRALAELAGPRPTEPCVRDRATVFAHKISVGFVDGELWNYTPEKSDESVAGKHILHFKGPRKDMMAEMAKRLI